MDNNYKIEFNENPEMCKKCGGRCCKMHPCDVSPYDIFKNENPTVKKLLEFLSSDLYQIDWWDGDLFGSLPDNEIKGDTDKEYYSIYMVRPRCIPNADFRSNNLFYGMYNGSCILLTDKGCSLNWNERPTGGKALVCISPGVADEDKCVYDKLHSANEWRPLQELFKEINDRKLIDYKEALERRKNDITS